MRLNKEEEVLINEILEDFVEGCEELLSKINNREIDAYQIGASYIGWDTRYFIQDEVVPYIKDKRDFSKTQHLSSISNGISRGVLVLNELPYVIKFDFVGRQGHCAREVEVYEKAEKLGLAHFLAEGVYYDCVGRVDFYLYRKIEKKSNTSPYKDSVSVMDIHKTIDSVSSKGIDRMCAFLARDIYMAYGFSELERICDFIEKEKLDDFADWNYGFDGDYPVVYDYCGVLNGGSYIDGYSDGW